MKLSFVSSLLLSLAPVLVVGATKGLHELNVPESHSSTSNPWSHLSRALYKRKLFGDDNNLKNSTIIEKSWDGATLLYLKAETDLPGNVSLSAGVEVTCTTCYIKGIITAELSPDPKFNISQAIANFTRDIGEEVHNITSAAVDYLSVAIPDLADNVTHFHWDDISLPPINNTFNLEIPDFPECRMQFQFDGLELYMLMDTVLSAGTSYTLNLYVSETPIGFAVDGRNFVGFIVSIDLILSVDADIDISSGLHIKIDDGTALDLSLFSQNVSSVTFTGGSFDFLPVTVQSANGVFTAKLRVGLHAGVSLDTGSIGEVIDFSTGAEVLVYTDLAEFTTNITEVTDGGDDDCRLRVQQVYQWAVGAAAGATLALMGQTWGPDPSTKVPIFYTTMADECVVPVTKTASASIVTTATATHEARDNKDMTTTTLTEEVTFTGVLCLSTGLAECPASLQRLTKAVSTKTAILTVPSGSEASFPATTYSTVHDTIPLPRHAKKIAATTGIPVSYVPPKPTTTSSSAPQSVESERPGKDQNSGGASVNIPLIVGLSVGLGVPVLIGVAVAIYFFSEQRRYALIFQIQPSQDQEYRDHVAWPGRKLTSSSTSSGGSDGN